jgi:hypothetical protein
MKAQGAAAQSPAQPWVCSRCAAVSPEATTLSLRFPRTDEQLDQLGEELRRDVRQENQARKAKTA